MRTIQEYPIGQAVFFIRTRRGLGFVLTSRVDGGRGVAGWRGREVLIEGGFGKGEEEGWFGGGVREYFPQSLLKMFQSMCG
jgi:hypothetical protein